MGIKNATKEYTYTVTLDIPFLLVYTCVLVLENVIYQELVGNINYLY